MPSFLPEGNTALPTDNEKRSLHKIVDQMAAGFGNLTGNGSPEGVVTANPGRGYVDESNGDLWVKQSGTGSTNWVLVSGGVGGSGLAGAGSPEGVTSAAPGTTYWDTTNKALYEKETGSGNTGWIQVV